MIEYRNVCKSFDGVRVLADVSCSLPESKITVFVGPSGVGKSVLMRMIVGLERPDSGAVLVGGENVAALDERGLYRLRRRMGMLFQDGALFDSMTAGENVAFPLRRHTRLSEREIERVVAEKLALVGMPDCAPKYPSELSGGMRKRVGLARAIALEPEIVLFDEPTSGLDPLMEDAFRAIIRDLRDRGRTVLLSSHILAEVEALADRVTIIRQGRAVANGTLAELEQGARAADGRSPLEAAFLEQYRDDDA